MPMAEMHKLPEQNVMLLKAWINSGADWTNKAANK